MISLISNHRHSRNTVKEARKVVAFTTFYVRACSTSCSIARLLGFRNNPTRERGNYLELQTNDRRVG